MGSQYPPNYQQQGFLPAPKQHQQGFLPAPKQQQGYPQATIGQLKPQVSGFRQYSPLKYPAVYTVAFFTIYNIVMAIYFSKTTTDVAALSLMDVSQLAEEDRKNRIRNGFVYLHITLAAVSILYLFFRERTFFGLSIISIITTFLICFVVMYMPTVIVSINMSIDTSSVKMVKDKTLNNLLKTNRFMLAIFGGFFLICLAYDYVHSDQLCCKKYFKGSLVGCKPPGQ